MAMPLHDDGGVDSAMDPTALGRLWDAMNRQIAPVGGHSTSASTDAAATIRLLLDDDDAPHLTAHETDALWSSIAAALALPRADTVAVPARSSSARAHGYAATLAEGVRTLVRQLAIGVIAGFLVGFVVIGGGLRLLMRLAAMLTERGGQQLLTENDNVVGQMTLGGTLALLFFTGALFGIVGGVVLMAVRPWLPASGWKRYAIAGIVGFATGGPAVLEGGENGDYRRFGILGLNVCLFTLLPVLFGIAVLPVIDWLDRSISSSLPGFGRGWSDVPKTTLLLFLVLPGLAAIRVAVSMPPAGLLLLLPLLRILYLRWSHRAPTRELRQKREHWEPWLARLALAVPCLVGLALMAQAIGRLTT
jgi:hypothetical protein